MWKRLIENLRKNWLNILLGLISTVSAADAAVGVRGGKSPLNVTVIPSILAALGAGGTLGIRWLNTRTVVARSIRPGVDVSLLDRLENLYALARDPDVTPEHAVHLADMAGDLLLAEHRRSRAESMAKRTEVINTPASSQMDVLSDIRREISILFTQVSRISQQLPPASANPPVPVSPVAGEAGPSLNQGGRS